MNDVRFAKLYCRLIASGEEMYAELHINTFSDKLSEETKRISAAYEVCTV